MGRYVAIGLVAALLLLGCTPGSGARAPSATAPPGSPVAAARAITPTAPAPVAAAPPAPVAVRVGGVGTIGDSAFSIGKEKGYYAEQGIDIEIIQFDSGPNMIPPLSQGQLEAGQGAISAGVLNAIARGVDIKAVASNGSSPPGHGNIAFVLRSDLVDQIKSPADLRGRKTALPSRGITLEVELSELLRRGDLTIDDVDLVQLNVGDQFTALSNRGIDLTSMVEPFTTRAVQQGFGHVWMRSDELIPNHMTGVIWYAPQFAAQTAVARRFMVAALKSYRLYNDAFFKDIPAAREELIPLLIRYTAVKDRDLYDRMVYQEFEPNGRVNRESIERDQTYFLAMGQQQAAADLDRLIDQSFADYAVQQLGWYER